MSQERQEIYRVLELEVPKGQKPSKSWAKFIRRQLAGARNAQIDKLSVVTEEPVNARVAQIQAEIDEKKKKAAEKQERRQRSNLESSSRVITAEERDIAAQDRMQVLEFRVDDWENGRREKFWGAFKTEEEYVECKLELLLLRWRFYNQIPMVAKNRLTELNRFMVSIPDGMFTYLRQHVVSEETTGVVTSRYNQIVGQTLNEKEQQRYQKMAEELKLREMYF